MNTKTGRLYALAILSIVFSFSDVRAANVFFTWASTSAGAGPGINAMISSTVTQGSFSTGTLTASEPNFVADFADSFSVLRYTAAQSAPGNILSTITFSSALPSGTRLLVIDVDFSMETVTLLGNENPLSLLAQRESTTGASSSFPSYNGATGKLVAVATNSNEASVFDLSGVTSLKVNFAGGNFGSGVAIAISGISAIPEPTSSFALPAVCFSGLLLNRRRRR
jgi:hypothetical protein